jgi:hypothetical protein
MGLLFPFSPSERQVQDQPAAQVQDKSIESLPTLPSQAISSAGTAANP